MNRKNLILAIILVVLIAVAFIYQGPWQDQDNSNNFLNEVNMDQVDKVNITRKGSSTVLIKEGEAEWKVQGEGDFYVETSVAEEFQSKMASLTKAQFELISTNKDKKDEFRSNKEKGSWMKMYQDGEKVADFIIGSLDPTDFNSTYVSLPDSERTYSAQGIDLTSFILRDEWRSKVMFDSSSDKISKIRFQYPNQEFTVEKKEGEWQGTIPRQFSVSQDKVKEVAQTMSDLEATKIPEQTFEGTGLSKHLIIVEASGNGVNNTIMVGEKDGQQGQKTLYYAKKGESDNVYLITKEQRDTLDQTMENLK